MAYVLLLQIRKMGDFFIWGEMCWSHSFETIWVVWFSVYWFSLHDIHNLYLSCVVRCSSRPVVQALRSSSWHSEFWVPLLPHAAAEMPVKTWLLVFRCYKQYLPCSGLKFSLLFAYFSFFCNSMLTCDFVLLFLMICSCKFCSSLCKFSHNLAE